MITGIDEILRQLKDSGVQMMNFEVTGLKIGDVEIDKMIVDPKKEGDREAASDFINAVTTHQATLSPETPAECDRVSLRSVMEAYIQESMQSGNWTNRTHKEYTQIYELLFRIVGKEIYTDELSYEISQQIKTILLKLPTNINKRKKFRNKTIKQIIAMGEKPRSLTTVNKILTRYSGLLGWGKRQGCFEIKENYFERLTINDPRDERDLRAAFDLEQLQQLFQELNKSKQTHSFYYWLPRIALYTGMRLNEICQLHLSDIKEIDGIVVLILIMTRKKPSKPSLQNATPLFTASSLKWAY